MLFKSNISRRINRGMTILIFALFVIILGSFSGCGKEKIYRVGILSGMDFAMPISDGFKEKMTELGYIEGKNIIYDFQRSNVNLEEYDQILQKFKDDKVDVIFCYPTEAAIAAKKATVDTKIPVVFSLSNIEGNDLIDSIREPGGNITGVRYPGPGIAIKRFEIMQELAPQAKRLWIPYQKDAPTVGPQLELLYPAAETAGVTLIEAPAADPVELETKLQALNKAGDIGIDAILFLAEPLTVNPQAFAALSKFGAKYQIPIGGALMNDDVYDSIFGVNVDMVDTGKQGAVVVDKILKGVDAGTIPVISSEVFLQINYKMVRKLEMNISEGLLSQANEIIR